MTHTLPRRIVSEFVGTGFLVATVVGFIMAGMPLGQVLAGRASAMFLPTRWGLKR